MTKKNFLDESDETLLEDLQQLNNLRDAHSTPMSEAENKRTTLIVVMGGGFLIGLVVLAFVLTAASNRGYFEEGLIGLFVGRILSRAVYFLCLLPIPVIICRYVCKNKILRLLVMAVTLVLSLFAFRNPVLDVATVNQPHIIQLDNAYLDFHRGGRRNSYLIRGVDAQGELQSFFINKKRFEADRSHFSDEQPTVTIHYLPHTNTVMAVHYE